MTANSSSAGKLTIARVVVLGCAQIFQASGPAESNLFAHNVRQR